MYERIPQKSNKTAQSVILILFFGSALLIAFPILVPELPYRWVLQLLSMALLTAAVFMTVRYVTKSYLYRVIADGRGGADLTVSEIRSMGKGRMTVCRVGVGNIRKRLLLDMTKRAELDRTLSELRKQKKKIFDYCVDFRPEKSILVMVEEGGEELAIRLSFDQELFDLLVPASGEEEKRGDAV